MKRRYAILDVFTDRPLEGNQLAVVSDAEGLDDERMQAIAREFNLSETVFLHPPENPVHSARLRIFTPKAELPFAGHPTVGTAVLLALRRNAGEEGRHEMVVLLEEEIGPVRCGVYVDRPDAAHAIFDLPQVPEPVAHAFDRDAVAGALGLTTAEIGFENHEPTKFTAGVPFAFVPVASMDVLAKAEPQTALWTGAFGGQNGAYVYTRQTMHQERDFRARMFAPLFGIAEDPATGSAVAAFAGAVQSFDDLRPGSHRIVIEQGFEMQRPSILTLEVDVAGGGIEAARIGGDAVLVAEGEIEA